MSTESPETLSTHGKSRGIQSLSAASFVLSLLILLGPAVVEVWLWWHFSLGVDRSKGLSGTEALVRLLVFFGGGALVVYSGMLYLYLWITLGEWLEKQLERLRGGPPWYRHPTDPNLFPNGLRDCALNVQEQVSARLETENQELRKLGIPIPECSRGLCFRISADEKSRGRGEFAFKTVKVTLPASSYSENLAYQLIEADPEGKRGVVYFLVGNNEKIDAASHDFESAPEKAIEKHRGFWVNRSPYDLYRQLHKKTFEFYYGEKFQAWIDRELPELLSPRNLPRLRAIKPWSPAEITQVLRRLNFFGALIKGCDLPTTGLPLPTWLAEDVAYGTPLPALGFDEDVVELRLVLGPSARLSACPRFWDSLHSLKRGIVFDLVADGRTAYFRLSLSQEDQAFVETQLQVHFPDFVIVPGKDSPQFGKPLYRATVSPTHAYRCLKPIRHLTPDPYAALLRLLDRQPSEGLFCLRLGVFPVADEAVQLVSRELERLSDKEVLLGLQRHWGWVSRWDRGDQLARKTEDLRSNLKHRVGELSAKLPGWVVSANLFSTNKALFSDIERHWLAQYETPDQRIELSGVTEVDHLETDWDHWTVWNDEELAAVAHFPDSGVDYERLERTTAKMKAPPQVMIGGGTILGINEYRQRQTTVVLPDRFRDRHIYIVGKTRTGKSTLMLNLVVQDVMAGKGVGVIDPHGDLVEDLLRYIPEHRIKDTIYFDASDKVHPIGLNILGAQSDEEVELLADDLLVMFRRLSESWGERMGSVLQHVFHTLLRVNGTTFFDIQNILVSPTRREEIIADLDFPPLIQFWREQFGHLPKDAFPPILTRMTKFVLSASLSRTLGQPESKLSFFDVIQNKRILLANLAQGKVGEDNAKLLGSLLVSQIQMAAMRRARLPREAREPFYLYVDEFHNFTTSAFDKILSEAGKYKLCLTLAHQYVSQLEEKIRNAILGNVGTIVMFTMWPQDAHCLRAELGSYQVEDLTNVSALDYEALCRPPTRSADTFKFKTLPPLQRPAQSFVQEIIEHSRRTYSAVVRPPVTYPVTPPERPRPVRRPADPRPSIQPSAPLVAPAPVEPAAEAPVSARADSAEAATVKADRAPGHAAQLGRGGQWHKDLQNTIKDWARSKGYRVTIEKQVLGGSGSVDVALEKDDVSIACEVSVTSTTGQEVGNIQKCLAAGFEHVVLISSDKKVLGRVNKAASTLLNVDQMKRVRFLTLEQLFAFIETLEARAIGREEAAKGAEEVLTAKEVERLLKIDVKTIYSYVERGLLPYVRIQSNLRFMKSEILKWIEEHRFRPKPPTSRK